MPKLHEYKIRYIELESDSNKTKKDKYNSMEYGIYRQIVY